MHKSDPFNQSYRQLFLRFLRFGLLAWGGPVAQIAMIRQELVEEEGWISRQRFNRVLAVYQALPGPEAHELCVYFGMLAKGRWGGLLAGLGFMLPGFLLMLVLAWFYVTYGIALPLFAAAFYGMQPAVAALIVRGLQRIGQHALHDWWLWAIAIGAGLLQWVGVHFLFSLLLAGGVYLLVKGGWLRLAAGVGLIGVIGVIAWRISSTGLVAPPIVQQANGTATLAQLLFSGLRTGLLTFGGAYSAISFMRQDAVVAGNWLSDAQFLDGIALGGILPAPLIIFGTFVGYVAGGLAGGIAVTLGIFTPAFAFSLIGHEWVERLVDNHSLHSFLDGLTAGVVGLIAATALILMQTAIKDWRTAAIFLFSLLILFRWKSKLSTPAVVVMGAIVAYLN